MSTATPSPIKDTNITRTAIADLLQTNMLAGLPHPILSGTSLNELWNIQENAVLANGQYPRFGYYAIGDRGHTMSVVDTEGDVIVDLFKHSSTDQACWRHVPFVMREDGNDLTLAERANYAGRTYEPWNGLNYWCYYLKRVPTTGLTASVIQNTVISGIVTPSAYTYDATNLEPIRPALPPDQVSTGSNQYMSISLPFTIVFDANDATELSNVAAIRYGNANRGIVSEILLTAGVDYQLQTTSDAGAQIMFNEAICTQGLTFLTTYHQMSISTQGFTIDLELGANEPMNADSTASSTVSTTAALAAAATLNIASARVTAN